jgi:DNA-binding response OmpR family regulator
MGDNTAPTVLVCDDTPAKRYVISSWLRRAGYRVVQAQSAGEAISVLDREPVDLAVLDVHLPDRSGLEVTSLIRSRPDIGSTPVVHISAVAVETTDRVAGLDVGADAYLVDPIDPEEMLSTVRSLLRASGARRSAELLAARSGRLHRLSVRLNIAANPARLADAAARAAAEVLDTVAVAVVVGDDGLGFRSTATEGELTSAPLAVSAVEIEKLLGAVDDATVIRADGDVWRGILPVIGEGAWRLWLIRDAAKVSGFIAVPSQAVESDPQSESLMQRLVQSVSVALGNLRALAHERRTALMLQRSLLPAVLPEPPGLVIAARYRASEQHAEVGGDFFDAFQTDDGRTFVVIGDIQGHSLEAAIVMAEIRYSLRAYAYDGHSPQEILDRLDGLLARRDNPELTVTACIATITADHDSMDVVTAGHLPPLLVRQGRPEYVACEGPLLGLQLGAGPVTHVPLAPGDRVLLMTDGLVERRDESLEATMDLLAADVAGTRDVAAETLADRIIDRWGHGEDDVALLIVDLEPPE